MLVHFPFPFSRFHFSSSLSFLSISYIIINLLHISSLLHIRISTVTQISFPLRNRQLFNFSINRQVSYGQISGGSGTVSIISILLKSTYHFSLTTRRRYKQVIVTFLPRNPPFTFSFASSLLARLDSVSLVLFANIQLSPCNPHPLRLHTNTSTRSLLSCEFRCCPLFSFFPFCFSKISLSFYCFPQSALLILVLLPCYISYSTLSSCTFPASRSSNPIITIIIVIHHTSLFNRSFPLLHRSTLISHISPYIYPTILCHLSLLPILILITHSPFVIFRFLPPVLFLPP